MVKREIKSNEAKHAIVSAAIVLFAKKGYKHTTIRDLCKESGYSVGAFYHHFKSKSEILDQMYQLFDNDSRKKIGELTPKNYTEGIMLIAIEHYKRIQYFGAEAAGQYLGEIIINHNIDATKTRIFETKTIEEYLKKGSFSSEFISTLDTDIVSRIISCIIASHVNEWCVLEGNYDLLGRGTNDIEYLLYQISPKKL